MKKFNKVVKINENTRDMVQRLWIDYFNKSQVIKGLLEDHQYDHDTSFIESEIFKSYEERTSKALYAYDVVATEMRDAYLPDEFKNLTNYNWNLDFEKCEITYTTV